MSKQVGIDATDIRCPEFTTPVISLIKKLVKKGEGAVIKTLEERALKRIQHFCLAFEWEVTGYMEKDGIFYIAITR
jgi:TusA-related sulfurtransferase